MSQEDLIPLNMRTPEERREIARLGGSVCSPAKSLAAKIRALRWTSDRKKTALEVVDCIVDADISAIEIMRYAESIKNDPALNPETRIKLLQTLIRAHEAIHGSRQRIEAEIRQEDPVLNINTLIEKEWEKAGDDVNKLPKAEEEYE